MARAIVTAARARGIQPPEPGAFTGFPSREMIARVEGRGVGLGTRAGLAEQGAGRTPVLPAWVRQEAASRTVGRVGRRLTVRAEALRLSRASDRLTATHSGLALGFNGVGGLAAISGRIP